MAGYQLVVVGTSWGGLQALRTLVRQLPATFPLPVAIVQHRHRDSDGLLPRLLQDESALPVYEVEDKMPIEDGRVYVAPPDYHLLIDEGYFSLSTEEPVRFSRPSIDVTFTAASAVYGPSVVGIVLTGANADGAEGLRRIVDGGGLAIVQDPATAESPAMPRAAIQAVPTALVRPLDAIASLLVSLLPRAARATPAGPHPTHPTRASARAEDRRPS